ncbi:hypothetical protein Q669_10355 [Labrenzia sp. C1B10]|nr:hypothetical protein Q669_10355 [Labrenzia sp. C1B10]ERP99202.1 hypothetical protein Q675_11555 [Labrenzia sp. C1B70]
MVPRFWAEKQKRTPNGNQGRSILNARFNRLADSARKKPWEKEK